MSDPQMSSDWTEKALTEELSESHVTLSEDDIREILNGQAELLDRDRVESLDGNELYHALIERYRQDDDKAYRRKMDKYNEDTEKWIPPELEEPATIIDFSHEVPTNYRYDDLDKERNHYGAKNPETGEIIAHMFWDEYVTTTSLEGDEEYDE